MPIINIENPRFDYDPEDPEGFRAGMLRKGEELGATETGTSVYEVPPGQTICPYHYEHAEEEWLLVLQGRPLLRTPEGERELSPWDMAFFPKGPAGAHSISNRTEETIRVLLWSTVTYPAVTVYPDSDKIGVFTRTEGDSLLFRKASAVGYYDGEVPPGAGGSSEYGSS